MKPCNAINGEFRQLAFCHMLYAAGLALYVDVACAKPQPHFLTGENVGG